MAPKRNTRSTPEIEALIQQRVAEAIAMYEESRNNGEGSGANRGNRNRGGTNNEGNGNEGSGSGTRPCSYKNFLSCKPENFKGTEGAVGLIQWFERMESVFSVSDCEEASKVKYAVGTLQQGALTWWNTYVKTVGVEAAHQLPWGELKRKMEEKYCPRSEMQKLEVEFWELTVKGTDIESYTNRYHELALLCPNMVEPELKGIERYVSGLPPHIQDGVTTSRPTTVSAAVEMAHSMMALHVRRETAKAKGLAQNFDNKRKWEDNRNRNQQPGRGPEQFKVYAMGPEAKKGYAGNRPLCNSCNLHHTGPCKAYCHQCKQFGHQANDCPNPVNPNAQRAVPRGCYECGQIGHYRKDCPKLKHNNGDDDCPVTEHVNAPARVYVMRRDEERPN